MPNHSKRFRGTMLKGYKGRILRINLTKRTARTEALDESLCKEVIGGKGIGAKILSEEMPAKISPFDPANMLIFVTGPVNGTLLPGAAKFGLIFKSPLTSMFGESYCGGYFAAQMKYAGYDALVIQGKAEKPVYVLIDDDQIDIKKADHLWRKDTFQTEEIVKKDQGERFQVLSIGPAGENLVKYACINHAKGRQFGRCGAGAVMGSKNLKAIGARGGGSTDVAEPEGFEEFKKELVSKVREHLKSFREYGTPAIIGLTNTTGTLPTRNWRDGEFEGYESISAETMKKKLVISNKSCFGCPVACGKISRVSTGPYAGTLVEGPEYETLFAFGSLCGNDNLEAIAKANEICDKLGMDTISAGNSIAFAMECYEKGIITEKDTDGIELAFGNSDAIVSILEKIVYLKGFGATLAEGVKRASEIIGNNAQSLAVHVKGLEPPGYDPRGLKGVALAYAVSCRGACHLRHMAHRPNLTGLHPFGGGAVDRLSYKGQADMVKEQEDFYDLIDSMVFCRFVALPTIGPILWEELEKIHSLVTGVEISKLDLLLIARRIGDMVMRFNVREGAGPKDDALPTRFVKEPLMNGASRGHVVKKRELEIMLDRYYKLKGRNNKGLTS